MPETPPASPAASRRPGTLQGRRILVAEDEFLLAEDLREELEREGAEVLGPVPSVTGALALLRDGPAPGFAILDINLQGRFVWPVADALRVRQVPFIFATGYDAQAIPQAYADIPRAEKPMEADRVVRILLSTP